MRTVISGIVSIIGMVLSVLSLLSPFMAIFITGNWWYLFLFVISWVPCLILIGITFVIVMLIEELP